MKKKQSRVDVERVLQPFDVRITQQFINRYAELSGDHNPIHVDPEFARKSPFGRTIAHGTIGATYLLELLNGWMGVSWPQGSTVRFTYTAPIPADESVRVCARLEPEEMAASEPGTTKLALWCETANGVDAIKGTVEIPNRSKE